jgi:hypothetical protein
MPFVHANRERVRRSGSVFTSRSCSGLLAFKKPKVLNIGEVQQALWFNTVTALDTAEEQDMDRYTKLVLTIIALGLWALLLENAVWPSVAQLNPPLQRVALCDTTGYNCVKVLGHGGCPTGPCRQDNEGALATQEQR